jgi:hypothetical protein
MKLIIQVNKAIEMCYFMVFYIVVVFLLIIILSQNMIRYYSEMCYLMVCYVLVPLFLLISLNYYLTSECHLLNFIQLLAFNYLLSDN